MTIDYHNNKKDILMNTDTPVTESELNERAVAPRVTQPIFNDHIASVHFINAGEVLLGTEPHHAHPTDLLTICVIVMKNGFTVTGESACASPENYQKDIGERISLEKAKEKMWPLLGYALKDHLAYKGQSYWATPALREGANIHGIGPDTDGGPNPDYVDTSLPTDPQRDDRDGASRERAES